MLTFVLPDYRHKSGVSAFYAEFEKSGESCIGYNNHEDFSRWLSGMQNRKNGIDLPAGYVRENFYLCCAPDGVAGVFSLKFELTPYLLHFGGHVGYAVAPSRRGRGIATEILRQGLQIAKGFGFERILAVCDEDNTASEKVILKNHGVFENKLFDTDENLFVKRYWIDLQDK